MTIDRGALKSALENPMFIAGEKLGMDPYRQSTQMKGTRSTKSFSKMGDGLSSKSVYEPAIMLSARKNPTIGLDTRSRSSCNIAAAARTIQDECRSNRRSTLASTPAMKANPSAKTLGIVGYRCSKVGLPYREPNYTIPKDESSSFFKHVTRATRNVPAPNAYKTELSW